MTDDLEFLGYFVEIRNSPFQRMYLEAALLATSDYTIISEMFGLPVEVIEQYEIRHYPVKNTTRLRKMEIIHSTKDTEEKNLKLWAVTQGIEFVKWRLGQTVEMSAVEGMQMLFPDCVFKAKEAFFSPSATVDDAEARKWAMVALAVGRTLKAWVTDKKGLLDDLEMAVSAVDAKDAELLGLSDIDDDPSILPDANNALSAEDLDAAMKEIDATHKQVVGDHPAVTKMYPPASPKKDWSLM